MATYGSTYVDAPVIQPYQFGLLDTVPVLPLGPHEALGTLHESEYCGVSARSYVAACVAGTTAAGTASISNSGNPNKRATLTVTGTSSTVFWVDWGDGTQTAPGALPATPDYASAGTYTATAPSTDGGP